MFYINIFHFYTAKWCMKTKPLKCFVNVSNDMTGRFFKGVEEMSNRYELVTD
jgi:hypothetical protein